MLFVYALLLALSALCGLSLAQIPCDEAYGAFCAEESGWAVGTCLKAQAAELPGDCKAFIGVHDSCEKEINEHCAGKEYSGDLLPCLTEWTSQALLADDCKAALPKKEAKEKVLSKEERKRAADRKKVRDRAAKSQRKAKRSKDL